MLTVGGAYPVPLLGGDQGGDGHILFLTSKASLTAEDADGGYADIFRYDSETPALRCVSCAPGGPDSAPFGALAGSNERTPSSNLAEQGRWVSEDGETAVFATAEPIAAADEDGTTNPYLWKEGQLTRLPGEVGQFAQSGTLSPDGSSVVFTTTAPLLPQDGDTARDAYVARAGGGFPAPATAPPCDPLSEGSCPGLPSGPGLERAYATEALIASGNQKARPKCRKSQVRKRGKCAARHHRKARTNHKQTSHKRGGSK